MCQTGARLLDTGQFIGLIARMTDQDLVADLKGIGFSDHEARIYIALFPLGRATAYEIAKAAVLPSANTYNVLRSLSAKAAVRKVSDNPGRYVAVDPAHLLRDLTDQLTARCSSILDRFETMKPRQTSDFVEIIKGDKAIVDTITTLIDGTSDQLLIKGDGELPPKVEEAILQAAGRGVACMFVHFGDVTAAIREAGVVCWPHEGNGTKLGMGPEYITLSCDGCSALIYQRAPEPEAAYSENKSFVYMTSVMIRHEIYLAEIIAALGDQIEARFGKYLHDLRRRVGLAAFADHLDIPGE